jgi:hypothetical protein
MTSAKICQGGDVYLSNSQGTLHLKLGAGSITGVGKHSKQEVPILVQQATGKYARLNGTTGLLTTWNIPANPNRLSNFSGYLSMS